MIFCLLVAEKFIPSTKAYHCSPSCLMMTSYLILVLDCSKVYVDLYSALFMTHL